MKKINLITFAFVFIVLALAFGSAQADQNVCCEKTNTGLFCQNVPLSQCALGAKQAPTSCDSTSFCKPGVCYSPQEGTCMDNTPQLVCNAKNSSWFIGAPAQCDLGCCILGDQAAFVSLVRCKRLAGTLGLSVNFNKQIKDEVSCVLSVRNQDRGACVYDFEFEKSCKFTTRAECNSGVNGTGKGTFYQDKLCSAPELGTTCGKSDKTTCISGREEVYFMDTCGNPANIYDSSKKDNVNYWTNVVSADNSCNPTSNNAGSSSCGNCNYLLGSTCRAKTSGSDINICADLNCQTTSAGPKRHGESWCVFDDSGSTNSAKASVGSRFYKHVCINGEEKVEACADYRQEECIQGKIVTTSGIEFSQAACRVNRWQDCIAQTDKDACVNTDKRDCLWKNDLCVPKNPTGLNFWSGREPAGQSNKASSNCTVVYEKTGLIGGVEKCISGCECIQQNWLNTRVEMCNALGDCGTNINWLNIKGSGSSYNFTLGGKSKVK